MPSFKIKGLLVLGEKIVLRFLTIYGHGSHLGYVTKTIYINFRSPFPRRLNIKFGLIGQAISEKKMFEIVIGRRTITTTTDAGPWDSLNINLNC